MNEGAPKPSSSEGKKWSVTEYIELAAALSNNKESFPFKGIDPEVYKEIKAEQDLYPGMSTPIDEIIERMKTSGIKVVTGEHPESGNIFILPGDSTDIENDSLLPRHLEISDTGHDGINMLIEMSKEKYNERKK